MKRASGKPGAVQFERTVKESRAERNAKGFSCWEQFVSMLFCQLGRAQSLREISGGLASWEGKLRHLGMPGAPARSTLAYASAHRPWELYERVFHQLLARCQSAKLGRHKFRFKNRLLSLDASTIDLCASLFDWAKFRPTHRAAGWTDSRVGFSTNPGAAPLSRRYSLMLPK